MDIELFFLSAQGQKTVLSSNLGERGELTKKYLKYRVKTQ
jgi:hypothetical protein